MKITRPITHMQTANILPGPRGLFELQMPSRWPFIFHWAECDGVVSWLKLKEVDQSAAERWRVGEAAAQRWFCNRLLYFWFLHKSSSGVGGRSVQVSGGGWWCNVHTSLLFTWYLLYWLTLSRQDGTRSNGTPRLWRQTARNYWWSCHRPELLDAFSFGVFPSLCCWRCQVCTIWFDEGPTYWLNK